MTGTDTDGFSASATFVMYYTSKPYVNKLIPNLSYRTQDSFSYKVPESTFSSPNGGTLTYVISSIPSWITYDSSSSLTISGTPVDADVGTYTLKVTATDTASQSASTTLQIDV